MYRSKTVERNLPMRNESYLESCTFIFQQEQKKHDIKKHKKHKQKYF